ncbi:5'/3'-nucleotidase SurE [Maritimibacter sp. HL-12]|jgi:5'-nucleotidase|uniref:5'/3'-nucleotidase SurE n=1 Tax=Maritimibacter sp. HL-12 TaxID=1162418 RepID=UPI000A0EF065|nr:5'/3'-nucleotidase SurE [Maritimibacter sp. HL-12]SMH30418.1 5'-nucleotidase /3'-nucleotidase /exopolyphosphatase [Maritimibacter sp. HL-12]
MRILITNDDGINAPGLKALEEIGAEIAGPDGEVWVVAPAFEQSGVGHCISYSRPMMLAELEPRRYAAEGTPADCVLAALGDAMPGRPDLVLSGINRGNNAAENTLYSGTIGAALEAALQGLPAIALSQFLGPEIISREDLFEAARVHGAAVIRALIERAPWDESADYRLFYNVNFPPVPAAAVKGVQATAQGWRRDAFFSTEATDSPSGRRFLWVKGGPQHTPTLPGTDAAANLEGYVSVTPMRADLTAHDRLAELGGIFS